MTGRITIGRFGLDLDTTELDTWTVSNGRVQVSGELFFATVAEATAARQQVAGLVEFPDPVYVAWADDPTQDGFYRVVNSSVPTGELTLVSGTLPWSVTLERSRGYAGLRPEVALRAHVRSAAAVLAGYFEYNYASPTSYAKDYGSVSPTVNTRTILGGATMDLASTISLLDRMVLAGTADLTYVGACKIRMGTTLYTVIGRQAENLPAAWELSNGITTVTPPTATAGLFKVQTVSSAGAAATVTYEVKLGSYTGGAFADVTSITRDSVVVVRESIESCAIRVTGRITAAATLYSYTLDLILGRGERGITASFVASGSRQWGVAWTTTIASTLLASIDNALEANAADADSNKPLLIIYPDTGTSTDDAANGKLWADTSQKTFAAFASSSCSGTANAAAYLAGNFFTPTSARQRMVHP